MTTIAPHMSASTILQGARTLAERLPERSAEIEAGRRLPADVLDELVGAGCFRLLRPTSHGGVGASLPEAMEMYEMLAGADASVGWTVMIGATAWCDLAGLPRATFDELFPPSADVVVAGAFAPSGSITSIDGGYEVTGRWGFVSGCEHATWIYVNALEGVTDGHPLLRAAVFAPSDLTIEDTWHVAGLRGTGSHHVSVNGAIVPRERTFVPLVDPRCVDVPITRIPVPAVIALCVAAVAVGAARGALDEIIELASTKVPLLASGPLATSPQFQHDLARADAGLAAARSLLAETGGHLWARAEVGAEATLGDRARARSAAVWATDAAVAATTVAFRSGGGGAIYDDSPLQRRLRDVNAIAQHFIVRPDTYTTVGGILAGQGLSAPVF